MYFYFCLQYVRSIPLYDFDLIFLETILKSTFFALLQGKAYHC